MRAAISIAGWTWKNEVAAAGVEVDGEVLGRRANRYLAVPHVVVIILQRDGASSAFRQHRALRQRMYFAGVLLISSEPVLYFTMRCA